MKRKYGALGGRLGILIILMALLLPPAGWGASSKAAERRYAEAIAVEKSADMDRAEGLYRRIVEEFPGTDSARLSEGQIERIAQRRAQVFKDQFIPHLNRMRTVVEGYWSLEKRYPARLSDLDRPDYPFAPEYLAGALPEGYAAYLALGGGDVPYRIWLLKDGFEKGFMVDGTSPSLRPVSRPELMRLLDEAFVPDQEMGRLYGFRPR